ncbi:MAG: class I SAM-dependent methyltransferase [Nitrospirae bacterium]|nr:MAG: class I SAM-dependent methyltransferase [Nitrospirota bacterium]
MKAVARSAMRVLLRADDFLTKCINRLAIEYDGGVHVKHRLMKYHDFFVERISPGERVLDVGCGYGAVAYSVASRAGAVVVGIDLRAENIVKARQLFQHPNLSFLQGDVLQGLPKESFDVIMLSNILEHIEQRVEFLTILHERLSPQRCLIRVPMFNRDWRVPLREELAMSYFSDPTHYTEYTQESFEKEIRAAGLTITHLQINWGEIWAEVRPGRS